MPEDPRRVLIAAELLSEGIDLAGIAEGYGRFFAGSERELVRLYENAGAWPGSQQESRATLLEALSAAPDLAVLMGAGDRDVFIAGDETRDRVTVQDAASLVTCGGSTHLLFQSSFVLAPGPGRSLGEAFLLAPRAEVATVIGSTGIGFIGITNAFSRHVLESIMVLGQPRAGEAMASAIRALPGENFRLVTQGMQLFGDPALPIRGPEAFVATGNRRSSEAERDPRLPTGSAGDAMLTASPFPSGAALAPASTTRQPAASTDARPSLLRGTPELKLAGHHPARSQAVFAVDLPDEGTGESWSLEIFDLNGRRVRSLVANGFGRGAQRVLWDLSSESGARVRPGLFFAQLRTAGASRSRLVVVTD